MTCTRCRWYKNERGVNCTPFFGNPNAEIVLCGEAFGATESETGEAFTGDSGKKLNELLSYIPAKREDLAILNSMRCYLEGNPTPTKAEMDACLIYTLRDLNNIDPKIVVALGRSAFYQLTGKDPDSFPAYRGRCIESDKIKRKVFVTYHPAACLYDPKKWDLLVEDFKSIGKYLDKDAETIKHYKYEVVNSVDIWNSIKQKLFDSEEIYADIETTGLSPYKEKLTTIQISNDKEPIYVIEDIFKDIKDDLKLLLETKNVVGQGFNFDTKFFKIHLDIFPNVTFDTCLAEYVLTGLKDNDLNSLVQKYTPESYGYWEDIHKDGGPHKTKNKDRLRQYGADDVGVLVAIKKKQLKQLVKHGFIDFYNNILIPCDKILTKMSLRGITYDLDALYQIDEKYKIKAEKLLFRALTLPGIEECERFFKRQYNARSAEMVRWLLLDYYKLPVLKTTKPTKSKPEGGPSVGQKEFEKYAEEYGNEYCKQMEKYRSVCNIRNTFLSGAVKFLVGNEAHTTYSLHATETGRPNSKGPNLLNIPRLKEIKSIFVARPGYSFIYTDAAQLEVRITAVVYNEPKLIDICNDPVKDMHCSITAQAFEKDYDYIYNGYKNGDVEITELRTAGKCVPKGTRVLTNKGYIRIESLMPLTIKEDSMLKADTLALAANSSNTPSTIIAHYRGKNNYTNTIETTDGYVIEATEEHLLRVLDKNCNIIWKSVKDIETGDYIGVSYNTKLWNDSFSIPVIEKKFRGTDHKSWYPDEKNPNDLAALLGLLISEGYVHQRGVSVRICLKDKEFIKHISILFKNLFKGRKHNGVVSDALRHGKVYNGITWQIHSADLVEWLDILKLTKTSESKRVPDCVFCWPKKQQVVFLKWLFEGDGSAKINGKGFEVCYSSKSYGLVKDIMLLLSNFGILCFLSKEKRKGYKDTYYNISVRSNRSKEIFKSEIGFITNRKNSRLVSTSSFKKDYHFVPISQSILNDIKPYIKGGIGRNKLRESLRINTKSVKSSIDRINLILSSLRDDYTNDIKCVESVSKIKHLLSLNVYWNKVKSKTFNSTKVPVYDVSVPPPHEVVYDGIVAHQSLAFGIIYQMGPAKLAYQLGITKEKAIDFIDTFYDGFSDLRKNIDKTKKLIIKQGWLRNYFGFVRRWKNHTEEDHNAQREGVNFLVQSVAWNLIQLAMIDVDKQIQPLELNNDAYLIQQIYDAIIVECRDEYVSEVAPIVKNAISNSIKPYEGLNRVSLRSDVEVGKRLSELKKLEI